jgi:DNA polymerase-3 subunit epsilon
MKIGIIDIETTSLDKTKGKIVEVGITELDLTTGKRKLVCDIVCHERPITREEIENSWFVKNSGPKDCDREVYEAELVQSIRKSIELKKADKAIQVIINYFDGVTAWNNAFDFGFMESRGFVFPKKLDDPMKVATPYLKLPKKRGSGYKWPSVMEAWKYFFPDTPYFELHRGGDDSLHEAKILYAMIQLGMFKVEGFEPVDQWFYTNEHGVLCFKQGKHKDQRVEGTISYLVWLKRQPWFPACSKKILNDLNM